MTIPCRVLMVYPKFIPNSFWNYTEACELVGAKYPAAPLGLITVAAMLPKHWDIRLVNRNTEPLTDADLDWADLVMIGGMQYPLKKHFLAASEARNASTDTPK